MQNLNILLLIWKNRCSTLHKNILITNKINTLYNLFVNLKEIDGQLNSIAVEQIEIPYSQSLTETQLSDNSLSNISDF
ncbi:MAG: hypothetical protein ACL7BU_05250 [Candidatus Phlomobacter fragariae]